uniref:Putative secreted peptide n=1 Tax=Anopheles braziliensis TaxID=58242 RepID=A0A2M3ZT96_9DIPT
MSLALVSASFSPVVPSSATSLLSKCCSSLSNASVTVWSCCATASFISSPVESAVPAACTASAASAAPADSAASAASAALSSSSCCNCSAAALALSASSVAAACSFSASEITL